MAATAIGLALVPVVELAHLTPGQLGLYAIAENKLGDLSGFDLAELKLEFQELESLDLDLTFCPSNEIDELHLGESLDKDAAAGGLCGDQGC